MKENMLEIPNDMQRSNVVMLCVVMGLTALLYMMIAQEYTEVIRIVTSQRVDR